MAFGFLKILNVFEEENNDSEFTPKPHIALSDPKTSYSGRNVPQKKKKLRKEVS